MNRLLLDTHTLVWYLSDPARLSNQALQALRDSIERGIPLSLSVISLVELVYLTEKGRLPPDAFDMLQQRLSDPASPIKTLPLDAGVVDTLRDLPRESVSEMPDRIIAATALHHNLTLVTRDRQILSSPVPTLWR